MTRIRPAWVILASALVVSLVAATVVMRGDAVELAESHREMAHSLSHQLARAGHLALLAGDRQELTEIAQSVLATDPVIASVAVWDTREGPLVLLQRPPADVNPLQQLLADALRALADLSLELRYFSQIPPAGEGSVLDPFGTPRANIGSAQLALSPTYWTSELAAVFRRGAVLALFLFLGLTLAGYVIAWSAARPLARLNLRLREISGGGDEATPDIERSLAAIGERLSRSEAQARQATETLRSREQELARAQAHADNATRVRADLIAGMSHELRAPLTAILGHTDLLGRGSLNRGQREHVATVQKSARNLLTIIDDVIAWSGLEAGRANLDEVGFDLGETVEDTLALLAPLAFEKDLELVHFIYQDVPLRLRGDPLRFQQVLTNLVSNAIKFTAAGSVVVRVSLEEGGEAAVRLRVGVTDTGSGIAPADHDKLFRMYGRLQSGELRPGGSGLGLAISKRLLELMGGSIHVESEPGTGSTFYFLVPMKKPLHGEQRRVPWAGLEDQPLWLADACEASRMALTHRLEDWRMQVTGFTDCAALARRLDEPPPAGTPELVVIGLQVADLDRPALAAALNAAGARGAKVLTLVTSIDEDIHQRLVATGAHRSAAKSIDRLRLYRELCELAGIEPLAPDADDAPLAHIQALVADDSEASRRYVAALLKELGAGVALAADGKAAVAAWRKGRFGLVLVDDQMAGGDGAAAIAGIRALAANDAQPRILAMTAAAGEEATRRLLAAGADACLIKPFHQAALLRHCRGLAAGDSAASAPADAPGLSADPQLAELLAREIPAQLEAVEAALTHRDLAAAKREIHSLHGTAAFYALAGLKAAAHEVEQRLLADSWPEQAAHSALRDAAAQALSELRRTQAASDPPVFRGGPLNAAS